jgi:hypothetical protein
MTMPVTQDLTQPVRYLRLSLRRKGDQSGREAVGALNQHARSAVTPVAEREAQMRTMTLTQVALHPKRLPLEALRRMARRLAVRLAHCVRFYADRYSAAVQYEDLVNLSAAALERRGIAPGDLHRQVADALPKWSDGK